GAPSAVPTYFAIYLHDAINVPVGIIGCAWGGTNIDAWIPHTPETVKEAKAPRKPVCRPGFIYRGSVAPLKPFAMRGVIWYQGEADANEAWKYESRMKLMYDLWGRKFENEGFPFLFAQLAPYEYNFAKSKRDLVSLQLAQAQFAAKEPNAHMAVVNDVGNLWDIHPNDKNPVGMRLAALALKHTYGFKDVKADAPVAVEAKGLPGGEVEISFDNGECLYVYNENRSTEAGFEVAGADGVFHPASIKKIDRTGKILTSPGTVTVMFRQGEKTAARTLSLQIPLVRCVAQRKRHSGRTVRVGRFERKLRSGRPAQNGVQRRQGMATESTVSQSSGKRSWIPLDRSREFRVVRRLDSRYAVRPQDGKRIPSCAWCGNSRFQRDHDRGCCGWRKVPFVGAVQGLGAGVPSRTLYA
ncbi:MAG: hypothetical protein IKJ45_09065, partial [Kiritimatiellae bacterium]|nr:hypothetical protein [Kiritimatiellia bacterium]